MMNTYLFNRSLIRLIIIFLFFVGFTSACTEQSDKDSNKEQSKIQDSSLSQTVDSYSPIEGTSDIDTSQIDNSNDIQTPESNLQQHSELTAKNESNNNTSNINFEALHKKITYGTATYKEVLQALADHNVAALTNTIHALYSMRIYRNVHHLLYDMWNMEKDKHPELSWDLIAKAPARIALASTINRIQIKDTHEFKEYIRSHRDDEHEFHRAQVVVALGLNGDPVDIPYLQEMANRDNVYVAQSAITGLAFMNNIPARDALVEIWKGFKDAPRGDLILEVLERAYDWVPVTTNNS